MHGKTQSHSNNKSTDDHCIFEQFTGLTRELPLNVHLLTLQSLGSGSYLLRLEHQFEIDEAPWNKPVTLSLAVSLFLQLLSVCLSLSLSLLRSHGGVKLYSTLWAMHQGVSYPYPKTPFCCPMIVSSNPAWQCIQN